MSMYQRAAQFAPFAALTGHNAAINETARLTSRQIELSEYERSILDSKMNLLLQHLNDHPTVTITYFVPDQLKEGGKYSTYTGTVKKWDEYKQELIFNDGVRIETRFMIDLREFGFRI